MSGTDATRQSEVDYVDAALRVHENVGRFHVTMHDICTLPVSEKEKDDIEIVKGTNDLIENVADMRCGPPFNGVVRLHDLLKIPTPVFLYDNKEQEGVR